MARASLLFLQTCEPLSAVGYWGSLVFLLPTSLRPRRRLHPHQGTAARCLTRSRVYSPFASFCLDHAEDVALRYTPDAKDTVLPHLVRSQHLADSPRKTPPRPSSRDPPKPDLPASGSVGRESSIAMIRKF